jgi:hypothetical protein
MVAMRECLGFFSFVCPSLPTEFVVTDADESGFR